MSSSKLLLTDCDRGQLVAIIKHFVQERIRCNAQSIEINRQVLDAYDRDDPFQLEELMLYWLLNKHDLKTIISEYERDVILAKKNAPYQFFVSKSHNLPSSAEDLIEEVKDMVEEREKFLEHQAVLMFRVIEFWRRIDCESDLNLIPLANLFSKASYIAISDFENDVVAPWESLSQKGRFSSEGSEYGRVITDPLLQQYLQEVPVIAVPEGVCPRKVQNLDIFFHKMHSLTEEINERNKNWTTTLVGRTPIKTHKHVIDDQNVLVLTSNEEADRDVCDGERMRKEKSSCQNPVVKTVTPECNSAAMMNNMYSLAHKEAEEARQRLANLVSKCTVQPADVPVGKSNTEKSLMDRELEKAQFEMMLVHEFNCYRYMDEADRKDELKVGMSMKVLFGMQMREYQQTNVPLNFEASRKQAIEYVRIRVEELKLERADYSEGPSKGFGETVHMIEWKIDETSTVLARYAALLRDHLRWDCKTVAILLMLKANSGEGHHYILENYCIFTAIS